MFTSSECRLKFAQCTALGKLSDSTAIRDDYLATANRWLRLSTVADYQERVAAAYEIPSLAEGQHRTKLPLRRC